MDQLISELTAVLFFIHLIQIWQMQSQENFKNGKKWHNSLLLYEKNLLIEMPLCAVRALPEAVFNFLQQALKLKISWIYL